MVIQIMMKKEKQNKSNFQIQGSKRALKGECNCNKGNDFVLKRYRLEQNRFFKEKQMQDLKYSVSAPKCEDVQEEEEEIVIVENQIIQFEDSGDEQPREADEDMVYVFQEDEQGTTHIHHQQKYTTQQSKMDQHILQMGTKSRTGDTSRINPLLHQKRRQNNLQDSNDVIQKLCHKNEAQQKQPHQIQMQEQSAEQGQKWIKGVNIIGNENDENVSVSIVDKKLFAISKLPAGVMLRCIIKRGSSLMSLVSPQYDLFLANGLKHIASAKKYPFRNRQLFKFSTDACNFDSEHIFCTLHSNTLHKVYWLLDQPKRMDNQDLSLIHMAISYHKIDQNKQRRFSVLLPSLSKKYQLAVQYQQKNINFGLLQKQIKQQFANVQEWKGSNSSSTKNFVIADEYDDYRYLQMRKQSQSVFQLIIQHPFTPIQAMAIAMTRFDVQLK